MQHAAREAFQFLSGPMAELGFLHSLWIAILLASLVALVFHWRPQLSHGTRHTILLASFAVAALAPLVVAPAHFAMASRPADESASDEIITVAFGAGTAGENASMSDGRPLAGIATNDRHEGGLGSFVAACLERLVAAERRLKPAMMFGWSAGVGILGCIIVIGASALRRICREAQPADGLVRETAAELARRAGLRHPPAVKTHFGLSEPFICGVFRPVILLPKTWLECRRGAMLEAILAHELAHARRRDHLVNLAQRLVETVLFFNPAVRWLSRSLRQQREFCADAMAVRWTGDSLALAEALESVARRRFTSTPVPAIGAALGGQSVSLLPRIQELIGMTPSRPQTRIWPLAALPTAGMIALIAISAGLAQERPNTYGPPGQYDSAQERQPTKRGAKNTPRPDDAAALAPHEQAVAAPTPYFATQPLPDRQISYEVRFLTFDSSSWRDQVKDRATIGKQADGVSAWVIDTKTLKNLISSSHVFQAPKVTVFDEGSATIFTGEKYLSHPPALIAESPPGGGTAARKNIAGIPAAETRAEIARVTGSRPYETLEVDKDVAVGTVVQATGKMLPGTTKLVVHIMDSYPTALPARSEANGEQELAVKSVISTVHEQRTRVAYDVADGSSLAVTLTPHQQGEETRPDATDRGSESGAGAHVRAKTNTKERMVVITPRQIVLEPEQPLNPPARATIRSSQSR